MRRTTPVVITVLLLLTACQSTTFEKAGARQPAELRKKDFHFRPLSPGEIEKYRNEVAAYYENFLGRRGFNGSILVAKNGTIIFEDYRGYVNPRTKEPITPETPFHLASVSKTFTGITVVRLWEQGKLSLNDSLQKFFPGFPYRGITVKMLLNHRSGLPNYLYFMDSLDRRVKYTNQDVLNFMMQRQPPVQAYPDRRFQYCNTNYVLLALIVEKLTGMPYPRYMKEQVFEPLGMKNSFVFHLPDTARYVPTYTAGWTPIPMDQYDCTYGDKNIYSTVRDMFLWDKALYEHSFISKAYTDSAFKPYSFERPGTHNYGLGFRMLLQSDTIIYHNGKWHGSNTAFTRFIKDTVTVIVLGNRYNSLIYRSKSIGSVVTGRKEEGEAEE